MSHLGQIAMAYRWPNDRPLKSRIRLLLVASVTVLAQDNPVYEHRIS